MTLRWEYNGTSKPPPPLLTLAPLRSELFILIWPRQTGFGLGLGGETPRTRDMHEMI